jgi:hypothetical protein
VRYARLAQKLAQILAQQNGANIGATKWRKYWRNRMAQFFAMRQFMAQWRVAHSVFAQAFFFSTL